MVNGEKPTREKKMIVMKTSFQIIEIIIIIIVIIITVILVKRMSMYFALIEGCPRMTDRRG